MSADPKDSALPYEHATELVNHWWWRPGWSQGTQWYAWHITLEDQPGLHALAAKYQAALADFDSLDLIPQRWLHITIQGLGDVRLVSDSDRDLIFGRIAERLATLPPLKLTFHRPVLHREAVVMPPSDLEPLRTVRRVIREGIADVWGDSGVPDQADGYRPHFSLAYVNRDQDPQPVLAALRGVQQDPVQVLLPRISFIQLNRDNLMYEWRTIATAPM